MDLLASYGSNLEKAHEGVWIPLPDTGDKKPGSIRVARMWNPRFKEAFRKGTNVAKATTGSKALDEDDLDAITVKCLAETILIDWKGIRVDGKVFKYSVDNAIKLLSDPRLLDFREKVVGEASNFQNYRLHSLEETTGKS